jgi:protein involved in polysaccharide export with SLBB domain
MGPEGDLSAGGNSSKSPPEYLIQPGDELDIKFFYNPELNETVFVRPDGKISLQLVDEVDAAGHTPKQLDDYLTEAYSRELRKPVVAVIVKSFSGQQVYVGGEVNTAGLITLAPGMSPLQAVINAGGLRDTASPENAIIVRKGPDDRPIPIRVNLKNAFDANDKAEGFQLQPYDIVYVPKTFIAKANLFVRQYIQDLLLYRGVSVGLAYRLDSKNNN